MFEIPYLENCAEILEKRFKNRVLQKVDLQCEKSINVSREILSESIVEHELKRVWRDGLSLRLQFKSYSVLELSFSTSAFIQVIEQNLEADPFLLNLHFSGGSIISVKDTRKSSTFRLNPINTDIPDALSKEFTFNYLIGLFSNKSEEIKCVLLDQNLIRGIGEAYADEILWYAGISPFSIVSKIPLVKVKLLYKTIKYVFIDAIKQLRKINPIGYNKTDNDLLLIHNINKKNSPTGGMIKMKVISDKKVYYTDEQYLYI
ncbi:Fpg/Nei family DNA glycosylase [Pedobacter cryoconitis]|uniref:DNA-(Apurinic or apyrimidinic site) lyase n=1 Tax=Pedobacter cryoconitis TaxID=188932 RepID=A0A327S1S6_9SPHI|nr:DNA-formamidopyrimidine glycosylase family protein [Pedobacter cryoconitis]RAJ22638.1 DNA-(apurinic or apyrimidinic site) lyase [Pedobacter cryoconitis]